MFGGVFDSDQAAVFPEDSVETCSRPVPASRGNKLKVISCN